MRISILDASNTAEMKSKLGITNPIPYEEVSDVVSVYVTAALINPKSDGELKELIDEIDVGDCLSLSTENISSLVYGGLSDILDTSCPALEATLHQVDKMEDFIEDQLDFYGAAAFLKGTCILIHRLS